MGVPIVLVHAGFMSSMLWQRVVPLLAPHARVITFDDRGHGHSTNPSRDLSYQLLTEDTAALIQALGLERPFVGGWSDGGQVAVEFGMRYPEMARGLIVGGAYTDFQSAEAQAAARSSFHLDAHGRMDADAFARDAGEFIGWLEAMHPTSPDHWQQIAQQTVTMYLDYSGLTEAQVSQVTTPAIVIHADRDQFVPLEAALQLFRWLPNADLAMLPGSDHFRPMQEPATLVAVLLDFVLRHQDVSR